MTSEELRRDVIQSATEQLMREHNVPAYQLLAALQSLEKVTSEYKAAVADMRGLSDEHATRSSGWDGSLVEFKAMLADHKKQMASCETLIAKWTTEVNRLTSIERIKGEKGDAGKAPTVDQVVQALRPHLPKAATVNTQEIVAAVLPFLKHQDEGTDTDSIAESLDEESLFARFIERIQKERPIDVSHLKNAESFIFNKKPYKIEELMRGAGGTGSSSGTAVYGEVVAGSGTAWTLASTPTAGTLRLFANGQRLTLTVDYSLSGAAITTLTSWATGTVLADYSHT